jgi:hypothetical protein
VCTYKTADRDFDVFWTGFSNSKVGIKRKKDNLKWWLEYDFFTRVCKVNLVKKFTFYVQSDKHE